MLNKKEIQTAIEEIQLIKGYLNLDKQLTPNGFDLTVAEIFEFTSQGSLDFSNKERLVPEARRILPRKASPEDKFGWWILRKGSYKIKTNEAINLPNHLIALAFSRTSLLRMGIFTQHGVWDAGFKGAGEFILMVESPAGVRIKQNARIAQLIFFKVAKTQEYRGIYQNLK